MKVSILIPAFHAEAFIATALESVRAQTHQNWEVVVVEDGSHDHTQAIVTDFARSCPQNVVYDNLGENRGVGTVRNRLLELAKGDALAFLDADDTWDEAHLANAIAEIRSGADVVVSGVRTFDLVKRRALEQVLPPPALVHDPVLTLFRNSVIVTSSCVVLTRAIAAKTGVFDTSLRIGEDRDYWLRCALEGARFKVTDAFTCHYAKHISSSMARTHIVAQHVIRFYEKYQNLTAVPARLRRHLLARSLICMGRLLRDQDRSRSAACLWRAWQCEPFNPLIPVHLAVTRWRSGPPAAKAA